MEWMMPTAGRFSSPPLAGCLTAALTCGVVDLDTPINGGGCCFAVWFAGIVLLWRGTGL
jgi:hypothetical protein